MASVSLVVMNEYLKKSLQSAVIWNDDEKNFEVTVEREELTEAEMEAAISKMHRGRDKSLAAVVTAMMLAADADESGDISLDEFKAIARAAPMTPRYRPWWWGRRHISILLDCRASCRDILVCVVDVAYMFVSVVCGLQLFRVLLKHVAVGVISRRCIFIRL